VGTLLLLSDSLDVGDVEIKAKRAPADVLPFRVAADRMFFVRWAQ